LPVFTGGRPGSPVIDIEGRVVALNAGGATGAASSFYLPLDRVRRALQLIQQGRPVTRGTLQTEFRYRPYDELRRLGLLAGTEAEVRKAQPDGTGMLVVSDVQPGSGSDGLMLPGDVLLRVNGTLVTRFEPLEAVLDDSVGSTVELQLQRGGKLYTARLKVDDLDAITPDAYSSAWSRHWAMARRWLCATAPSTTPTAASCARCASIGAGFPRDIASATTRLATGSAAICPP